MRHHPEDAIAIAAAVQLGKRSAAGVVDDCLARIAAREPVVNAFTAVTAERARAKAADIDRRRAAGAALGPLAGVPFAVKNLIDIAGLPTLAGARINKDLPPAARDGYLVRALEAADAILVGALNMGEYAYDFTGENVHFGPSRNPHDPSRMTGGSSGGSGAAVASGEVPLALGSDTNGSIRVPSSLCGLFGLKPTYGRLSRGGSFPFVGSFDHLGPFARSTHDLALSYDVMQGHDPDDPAQTERPREAVLPHLLKDHGALRVAVADDYFTRLLTDDAREAVAAAAAALGATRRVTVPEAGRARAAAYVITASEGAALHLDRLKQRGADFDPAVRDRLIAGAMLPAAWVHRAQRFRRWYHDQVLKLFDGVDAIIAPSTPCTAPAGGQAMMTLDGVTLPVRANLGIHTQPISFIGLPVAAVPIWRPGKMPIGVQIIAAPWREDVALRLAMALELQGVARSAIAGEA